MYENAYEDVKDAVESLDWWTEAGHERLELHLKQIVLGRHLAPVRDAVERIRQESTNPQLAVALTGFLDGTLAIDGACLCCRLYCREENIKDELAAAEFGPIPLNEWLEQRGDA